MRKYRSLSKLLALILRHDPHRFGVEMRPDGYVNLDNLVEKIKKLDRFSWVTRNDIIRVVRDDEKQRFELSNFDNATWIRARYGHNKNLGVLIEYPVVSPQEISLLYHGTIEAKVVAIEKEGLKPMDRVYVHLSSNLKDAIEVAKRRIGRPVVIVIDARKMIIDGYRIFKATNRIYLTRYVPPKYIIKVLKNIETHIF